MKSIFILAIIFCLLTFNGCVPNENPSESVVGLSESESLLITSGELSDSELVTTPEENFAKLFDSFASDEIVKGINYNHPENFHLLEKWVEDYEKGIPASVAVYNKDGGFPAFLHILESNGTQEYTITFYREDESGNVTATSSKVVERTLDYVLGADTDSILLIVKKQDMVEENRVEGSTDWKPSLNPGITYLKAEQIALNTFEKIYKHQSLGKPNHSGGSYYAEEEVKDVKEDEASAAIEWIPRTVATVEIASYPCYVVDIYQGEEQMAEGMGSGNTYAVSGDGVLCFTADVAHGGWIFSKDENEKIIIPN